MRRQVVRDTLLSQIQRVKIPPLQFWRAKIDDFSPLGGYPGTVLEIRGHNFASVRQNNEVMVGGKRATVIEASPTVLKVITDPATTTGPVSVRVGLFTTTCARPFKVLAYPDPYTETDGPPIFYAGTGYGQPGDVPSTGTLNVLVVLVNPSDRTPSTTARDSVVNAWTKVHTFYDQASYGRLNVQVDITANWHVLTGTFDDYVDTSIQNIRESILDRLMAEAAQAAVNEGFDLNDYAVIACVINLNGTGIRAWGGWTTSNFTYADANINITVNHDIHCLAIQESADWGRCAHELGHNIVSIPSGLSASPGAAILEEDVYASDLIDPTVATAQQFEMMGNHNAHPLFSAFFMDQDQLGYYNATNIKDKENGSEWHWSRNGFIGEYEVVAHGLMENTVSGRYHLLKICVADGLYYYIEVRQKPGSTTQIFDTGIPTDGAPQDGGVVVTAVVTGVVNMNQQLRFITLLHDPCVLKKGDTAIDPARAFKVTVLDDQVSDRPLVCRVRVEWAQGVANDPNGAFDLNVEPWDSQYQTPDIWVDRLPYNVYDQPLDTQGRPQGNGDKPRPKELNYLHARIHCSGTVGATDVNVTFYTVEPPGVGDNGNWAPRQTITIPSIDANKYVDTPRVNWVPEVDKHTCLKVYVELQPGEITGGDNSAQENIFQFEAAASSVPEPIIMPLAVRNPLKRRTIVYLGVKGVPTGYTVHVPHAWVWLSPLEERQLELTIIPTLDYSEYIRREIPRARIRVTGDIPRSYNNEISPGVLPASRMFAIGGITAEVTPKRRTSIQLSQREPTITHVEKAVTLFGIIKPAMPNEKVRIDLVDPDGHVRCLETTSDDQGQFRATFDLSTIVSGVYKAQALIINSPHAAQAESNVVYISR